MKIIALMLCRDENWVLRASLDAALRWCDGAVVLAHACKEPPGEICIETANRFEKPIMLLREPEGAFLEMDFRQRMLEAGRQLGGTHWGLVDPDEVPTANVVEGLRMMAANLEEGQSLDLPMVAVWESPTWPGITSYTCYRTDQKWAGARIDVVVKDSPRIFWRAADDGYQHHHRLPKGVGGKVSPMCDGGIMHLQFLSRRRLLVKHAWYKMMERVQYPQRAVSRINDMYNKTPSEEGMQLRQIPDRWLRPLRLDLIDVHARDWHLEDAQRMMREYGRGMFEGLDLFGVLDEPVAAGQ